MKSRLKRLERIIEMQYSDPVIYKGEYKQSRFEKWQTEQINMDYLIFKEWVKEQINKLGKLKVVCNEFEKEEEDDD